MIACRFAGRAPFSTGIARSRRVILLVAMLIAALPLGGCAVLALPALGSAVGGAGSAVKAGTEFTKNGTAYRTFSTSFDTTHDALLTTLKQLGIKVTEEERYRDGSATIRAQAYGRKVVLGLEPVTPRMTRLRLTVSKGLGKDRATASEIITQAERALEPPTAASPRLR
jgi:Protein of unknown function (DUF3568)